MGIKRAKQSHGVVHIQDLLVVRHDAALLRWQTGDGQGLGGMTMINPCAFDLKAEALKPHRSAGRSDTRVRHAHY